MKYGKFVLYQIIIVAFLILSLEVIARTGYSIRDDWRARGWDTYAAKVGWSHRINYDAPADCGVHRTFDERGLFTIESKRLEDSGKGRARAMFVGDSNTYGFCVDTDQNFVEVAGSLVPDVSVVNLGVSGYTSFQGLQTLRKYGDLISPDIIFVSFNFNDRRYILEGQPADDERSFEPSVAELMSIESSHALRFVRGVARHAGLLHDLTWQLQSPVNLEKLRARVEPKNYRENLSSMVAWARQRNVPIAFIILRDNPMWTELLRIGIQKLDMKDYDGAIKDLAFARDRKSTPTTTLARLYLAKAYRALGKNDLADQAAISDRPHFSRHGGEAIYLDTDYNRIMREVAGANNVPVVDMASVLEKTPRVFFDICHFDEEGHEIAGKMIADALMTLKYRRPGHD